MNGCWWVTNTIYTSLWRSLATKTWPWFWNIACDNKRKLTLSNWSKIWDLAWNVREHVNKANTLDWSNSASWKTSIAWSSNPFGFDDDWIYASSDMNKYGSKLWYWRAKWMWHLYYATWKSNNIFLRGGPADYGAGIFSLSLHLTVGSAGAQIGFRCAR